MTALSRCVQSLRSERQAPSLPDIHAAMNELMQGDFDAVVASAFLTLLDDQLLTPDIVATLAQVMRSKCASVHVGDNVLDVVGTGGDGHNTFNVSTFASIVVASLGARVVKQGNRAATSKCGSADFLEYLGANIAVTAEQAEKVVSECGFCFLFAPQFHPSMKHVSSVRSSLGFRTVFNVLGPLSNPASPSFQLSGIYKKELGPLYAQCFVLLGIRRGMVVHGMEGLDEISPAGPTMVWTVIDGNITESVITPEDFGLQRHSLDEVCGGDCTENAEILNTLLLDGTGAISDFVCMNAAAALFVADLVPDLKEGVAMAKRSLEKGLAKQTLANYIRISQEVAGKPAPGNASFLAKIVAKRSSTISALIEETGGVQALLMECLLCPPPPAIDVVSRLSKPLAVMAEIKRASPSKGVINPDVDVQEQALAYSHGGASVISVLTEPNFFMGSLEDMKAARQAVDGLADRPAILLKDFVLNEFQLVQARQFGADMALLIARILDAQTLHRLIRFARRIGLETLVEVNNEQEMETALRCDAHIIGINNRNLETFEVDVGTTTRLAPMLPSPDHCVLVSLSGILTRADVEIAMASGCSAVLVGESLMRSSNPTEAVATLLKAESTEPESRSLVKICGLSTSSAAMTAAKADADLLGLIFVEGSRRSVDLQQAREIIAAVRGHFGREDARREGQSSASDILFRRMKMHQQDHESWFHKCADTLCSVVKQSSCPLFVGVFMNQDIDNVNYIATTLDLDLVQFHGNESEEVIQRALRPVIKVVHVKNSPPSVNAAKEILKSIQPGNALAILLDTQTDDAHGGTGKTFDWQVAKEVNATIPVFVAGGLSRFNVSDAISMVRPLGVDVSSGVEQNNVKSDDLIQEFVSAARRGFNAAAAASVSVASD